MASPRHADSLQVTGPITRNMAEPLRRTYDAVPAPQLMIAVGDRARNCGVFGGMAGQTFTVTLPDVLPLLGIRLALPVALTDTIVPDLPLTNKGFNLSYAGNDL